MTGSEFIFDIVQTRYYKCNFRRGGSYIDSPVQIEKKTINSKNKDNKFFKYGVTITLSSGEIESHPERVSYIHIPCYF